MHDLRPTPDDAREDPFASEARAAWGRALIASLALAGIAALAWLRVRGAAL
jgi:hypothetical protein